MEPTWDGSPEEPYMVLPVGQASAPFVVQNWTFFSKSVAVEYDELVQTIIKLFFLPGKTYLGTIDNWVIDGIGTYQSGIIDEETFDLENVVKLFGCPSKTKLYLFLTNKVHKFW